MRQNSNKNLTMANKKEGAFTIDGFCNWKKAISRFQEHESSTCHSTATTYESIVPSCQTVPATLDKVAHKNMASNRKALIKIIETLLYLGRQGSALRGHIEQESNFRQLLELRAVDVPELRAWLDKPERSDKYTSHDPQNEILQLAANSIVRDIVSEVKGGKCHWFSLIADEYSDVANKEQLSINVRWIDDNLDPHEDFLGFYEIPNIKSETIYKALTDALLRADLPIRNMRGQCYDGASNMLGKNSGVAKRIQEDEPKAFETHCHCHSLSLSVKDSTKKCCLLNTAMSTSKEVVALIKFSPKREKILGDVKSNIEHDESDNENSLGLAKFSATRWTVRAGCFNRIYLNYKELQETWVDVLAEGGLQSEVRARIIGVQAQMTTFEYFFSIILGFLLFSHTDNLSRALQGTRICATEGHRLAKQTVKVLKDIRNDNSFDNFWQTVLLKKKLLPDIGKELNYFFTWLFYLIGRNFRGY